MEENYFNTEGTHLMFETPGFHMLLSLLMICAVLDKTLQPNPQNTTITLSDVSIHGVWSPRFSSKEFFVVFQKRKHHCLIFFCQFQATASSKKKTPGTQRQYTCLSAEGKALVNKSPSLHHTHRNQLGCLGPSLRCVSPCFHMYIMYGCNFAFCIPQLPTLKAAPLLKYLWCSCSESLSLSSLSVKWG